MQYKLERNFFKCIHYDQRKQKISCSSSLLPRNIGKLQHPVHCSFNKSPRAVKCLLTNKRGDLGVGNINKVNIVHLHIDIQYGWTLTLVENLETCPLISGLCMQCLSIMFRYIRLNKYEHMKHMIEVPYFIKLSDSTQQHSFNNAQ